MERWERILADVERIRSASPLVFSVTNNVVTNVTANALLALGASPAMSHAPEDAEELAGLAAAVVLNIGTPEAAYLDSMVRAAAAAARKGTPIVLDPVAVGATRYRAEAVRRVLAAAPMTVIRGNASEIMALAGLDAAGRGVDSLHDADEALDAARALARSRRCVVCASGARDTVTDGERVIRIANGHPMMPRVTGLGCTASALIGALAAVNPCLWRPQATPWPCWAWPGSWPRPERAGPGSLQVRLYDVLYALSGDDLRARLRWEEA